MIPASKKIEIAERIFGKPLYPYQREIIEAGCSTDWRMILASRQTGKSTTLALEALIDAVLEDNYTVLMISLTERKASDLLDKSRIGLRAFGDTIYKSTVVLDNLLELRLRNGSRILSLSSDPDAARGYTADSVLIDEAAFLPWQDELLDAVSPSSIRKGRVTLSSTPNGIGNLFYDMWSKDNSPWKIEIPWYYCPDLTNEKMEKERERCRITGRSFACEYELSFDQSVNSIFSLPELKGLLMARPSEPKAHLRVLGFDPARTQHNSAVVVIDVTGDRKEVIHLENLRGLPIPEQCSRIEQIVKDLEVQRVIIDAGGGYGKSIQDILTSIRSKVKMVDWTAKLKKELIYRVKTDAENGRFFLWDVPNIKLLMEDLMNLNPNSTSLFTQTSEGHCDWAAALMLCYNEFKSPTIQPSVRSAFSLRSYGAPMAERHSIHLGI